MMSTDTNEDDQAYAALQAEMAQPSPYDNFGAGHEPEPPIDQQVEERHAAQDRAHQAVVDHATQPRYQRPAQQDRNFDYRNPDYNHPQAREEDPIGYFDHHIGQIGQAVAQRQFWGGVQQSEDRASKELSDYDDACAYVETARRNHLAAIYPDHSPQAQQAARSYGMTVPQLREAMLNQDRTQVAQLAMERGQSPAHLYLAWFQG